MDVWPMFKTLWVKEEEEIHLSTHLVTLMLISYNRYRGMVTRMSVIRSGGVMMAATSIMMRNECLRYLDSICDVMILSCYI